VSKMKKQQRSQPAIVIEWNSDAGASRNGIDGVPESDLIQLARALGRMAARRDLAAAREKSGTFGHNFRPYSGYGVDEGADLTSANGIDEGANRCVP
jgi:hypothetical protein